MVQVDARTCTEAFICRSRANKHVFMWVGGALKNLGAEEVALGAEDVTAVLEHDWAACRKESSED